MKTWTIETILAEQPCTDYRKEDGTATPLLYELMGRRKSVTILDVARDQRIPVWHRLWLACRGGDHVKPWLDRVVARAVSRHALHCGIKAVEVWAAQWLSGERRDEEAAWAAAAEAGATWVLSPTGPTEEPADPGARAGASCGSTRRTSR